MRNRTRFTALAGVAVLTLALAACGSDDGGTPAASGGSEPVALRLGFFPNLTHAGAIAGVEKGFFDQALPDNVTLTTQGFNAGPAATEAFFAGEIDATFIGPNPAINGFAKSKGEALRIVSGATSGGAYLVVKPGIESAADLKGKKLATPQLGNTQDVALRYWLKEQGLTTDTKGGGEVSILPQENSQTLQTFGSGQIDGAWVPEPWATRLVQEAGGTVLIDEKTLWPKGQYVTTHLMVRTEYLEAHPDVVQGLIEGLAETNDWLKANPTEAQKVVNEGIGKLTGKPLAENVIAAAWGNLTFTLDPIPTSLYGSAEHAEEVGLLDPVDLKGIYDLTQLNEVLVARGLAKVVE
jgi:NitT/TauT family transport system substrate-binding protein